MNFIKYIYLTVTIILLISSYKIYESYKIQYNLISEFNTNQVKTDLNIIDKYQYDFPNLSATSMPLKAMVSRYYFKERDFKKALLLLDESRNHNKYLMFNEATYADYFYQLGQIDSAVHYSKKAFYGIPNNSNHFTFYMKALATKENLGEIIKSFELVKNNYSIEYWRVFLATMVQFHDKIDISEYLEEAKEKFPKNEQIEYLINLNVYGQDNFKEILKKLSEAEILMKNSSYKEAVITFNEINPNYLKGNSQIYLNIVKCYLNLKDFELANSTLEKTLSINPKNGEAFYLKAIVEQNTSGNDKLTCELLKKSYDFGFKDSNAMLKKFNCQN